MTQQIQEIDLTRIRPNPANPRKRFSGPTFNDLVASVKKQGVISPILVRPVKSKKTPYEIIFGERRFRASLKVARQNGGLTGATIPAMVRELDDSAAFDLMTIENLQREDLTPLEEARAFAVYLNKKGDEALPDLAERTGIHPRYIRRRVAVLDLPKAVLKMWDEGEFLYGHLEQLVRVKNNKPLLGKILFEIRQRFKRRGETTTVKELKSEIDSRAPALKHALFDLKKAGCTTCQRNSDVQKKLFDLDGEKKSCLDPRCFKQQQNNWLLANWEKSKYHQANKTVGFRFREDFGWNDYESFGYARRAKKACHTCEHFVTLISVDGSENTPQACIGDKKCFKVESRSTVSGSKSSGESKRPTWHGEHFREKFYQATLPEKIAVIDNEDERNYQLALFALLKSNNGLHEWFSLKTGLKEPPPEDTESWERPTYYHISHKDLFAAVSRMDRDQIMEAFREAAAQVVLQSHDDGHRHEIAKYVGIDLGREFAIDEEYCKKKTKAELLSFAQVHGITEDKKAKDYLYEVLLKKRGRFESCKKSELVKLLLESGVELTGKTPLEIFPEGERERLVNI